MNRQPVNVQLLETYAAACRKVRDAEKERDMLSPMVLQHLQEIGAEKVPTAFGLFIRGVRKTYKFSDLVKDLEAKLKKRKAKEIEEDSAEVTETEFVTYRLPTV